MYQTYNDLFFSQHGNRTRPVCFQKLKQKTFIMCKSDQAEDNVCVIESKSARKTSKDEREKR